MLQSRTPLDAGCHAGRQRVGRIAASRQTRLASRTGMTRSVFCWYWAYMGNT